MRSKKTSIMLVIVMIATVFAVAVSGSAEGTIPDGMVSYWRLDEGGGGIAGDSADANDGNLKPITGPSWTTGKVGGALSLDGLDNYVNCGNDASLAITGSLSIEAWIKPNVATDKYQIVSKWDNVAGGRSYWLDIGQNNLRFYISSDGSSGDGIAYTINAGQWQHVVGTFRDSDNLLSLYINSANVISKTSTQNSIYSSSVDVLIGALHVTGSPGRFFDGLIDETRIYSRALTAAEIQEHYNGIFNNNADLAGLWHFDDASDNIATDSSSNNNHGILLPSGPTWTTGIVDDALSFDGVDDYVKTPNLGLTGSFSAEFWFKPDSFPPYGQYSEMILSDIWDDETSTWSSDGFYIGFRKWEPTQLTFQIRTNLNHITSSTTLSSGQWYHAAFTHDADTTISKIYINGVEDASGSGGNFVDSTLPLKIGADQLFLPHYFDGDLDEVAIWDKALTSDEVLLHYTNGLIGKDYCYVPPDLAIQNLFQEIGEENLPQGTENSLLVKLDSALESLENGEDKEAMNVLNAFINAVEAQRGKKLTDAQADELIAAAEDIITTINES
ncbi:MAG: LamG domain-containing protein [Thermoplasmata archaeon]|nr:MAG: LamG domain-containing protein [Thermoplasmata archaeon]